MTVLVAGAATDTGRVRAANQDAVLVTPTLFAVADGMGGHAAGEVASRLALDTLVAVTAGAAPVTVQTLVHGVQAANEAILEHARLEPHLRGMGTTLCVLALVDVAGEPSLAIANVGDSRVYVLQDGTLVQVTRDHSYVEDLVSMGRLTHEEARSHPQRNILTRALGIEPDVKVDVWQAVPFPGDRYLLCSDGLFNEVDDAVIRRVLMTVSSPQDAADTLVHLANDGGGRDNISVIVVDVTGAATGTRATAAPPVELPDVPAPAPPAVAGLPAPPEVELRSLGDWLPDDVPELDDTAPPGPPPVPVTPPADEEPAQALEPPRSWWRRVVLVAAVLAVLGLAFGAIAWTARGTYTVTIDGDRVVLLRGRSLLWFEPTLEKVYAVDPADLLPDRRESLADGRQVGSVAAADRLVANLVDEAATTATTSTTSTTTATAVTTTIPTTTAPVEPTVPVSVP